MVTGIFLGIWIVPIVAAATIGSFIGYTTAPDPLPAQILGVVLTLLWLLWLITPVLLFQLNESLDLSRLLVYPIPRGELVVASLLGTLLDPPTWAALPVLGAALLGWLQGPATLFVAVALAVAYFHMVMTSQLIAVAAGGVLRSRRFRDIFIILGSLVGSSVYFVSRGLGQLLGQYTDVQDLRLVRPLEVLRWLPPGAVARGIEAGSGGGWGVALGWLGYSVLWLIVIAWAWWKLMVRLTTGGGFLVGRTLPARAAAPSPRRRIIPRVPRWIPWPIWQTALKELRTLWRVPKRRVMVFQVLIVPAAMAGYFLFRGGPLSGVNNIIDPRLVAGGMVGFSAFITWTLGNNMLGMEGQGLQSLLLSPVPRTDIFLGKALGILSVTGSAVVIAGLAAMAVAPGWPIVAGVVAAVAVGLVILGVEAVFSVAFPYPVNLESTTRVSPLAAGGGCVGALILTFGTPVVSGIAGLPPVALMGLAWLTGAPPAWQLLASGAGLAYGMGALLLGARLAGQRLARREPEVIAATRLED